MAFLRALALLSVVILNCQSVPQPKADEMWISMVPHGESAFHARPDDYSVYRNVLDFGCIGDGVADDTACFNRAVSTGGRCGDWCEDNGSSTLTPALVYVPSGTYLLSSRVILYYFTQLVGNANDRPVLKTTANFDGFVLDANPYGGGGNNWYQNQNNFFRQVRNFVIDMSESNPASQISGVHWQVAQATSLVNIRFVMSKAANTAHQGLFIENGSGGFMSDLVFEGGKFGMAIGNQQFLSTNLVFNDCKTAISLYWNWQWTFKNIQINNAEVGIDMSVTSGEVNSGVGSILLLDSVITGTGIGVLITAANPLPERDMSGTLLLDNVQFTNTPVAVGDSAGATILPGGSTTITSWGRGSLYTDKSGKGTFNIGNLPPPQKSGSLLDGQGRFFQKSRPQYENLPVSEFVSIIDYGAFGNGREDDSNAIQNAINEQSGGGKIIYFPHGAYIISRTITVHPGTRMIGELWSMLMASGTAFQDPANPQPMIRVGTPGQEGTVEITDFMFVTRGAQPGCTLLEWNIRCAQAGSCGMWDSHFRVGGFAGSQLVASNCPRGQGYTPVCHAAFMLMHVTASASGYFENVWAWTGDHDLDSPGQITIYVGRGVLIEANPGPVWLYGTQSEHNILYQYQLTNAKNIFLTMLQGETPYWQPGPPAPAPFTPNPKYDDPTYAHCGVNASTTCGMSYGLRSHNSDSVFLYGAGLYNFFNNYDQTCLMTESCQDVMINLEDNTNFYSYNVNSKAATNIYVAHDTEVLATQYDNRNGFCQTVNAFLAEA